MVGPTGNGVPAIIPSFGSCGVQVNRIGTRVAIVLFGKHGVHFQIHGTSGMLSYYSDDAHSFSEDAESLFTGTGLSIVDINGKWIAFAVDD
jgi:hypothetical protein